MAAQLRLLESAATDGWQAMGRVHVEFPRLGAVRGEDGDTLLSLQFRRLAAGLGNARAMSALGCHYEFGYGVTLNEETATMWYARAEAAGFTAHSRMKSAILKQMRRPPAGFRRTVAAEELRREADAVQNEETM